MHLTPREASSIIFFRYRMKMSISHIAKVLDRSTRTIHKLLSKNVSHKTFDKRKWPRFSLIHGETSFRRKEGLFSWFVELWKEGMIENITLLSGSSTVGEPP